MSSTFPIFRLPLVALRVVINHFHLNHLVIVSFCSQRAQRILRLLRKKNPKTCIEAKYSSMAEISLTDTNLRDLLPERPDEVSSRVQFSKVCLKEKSQLSEGDQKTEFVNVGAFLIPFSKSLNENEEVISNFYFEERFEGLKVMLEFFTWFFETSIFKSLLNSHMYPDQIRNFLDYVMTQQNSLDYCHVKCEKTSENEIQRILDVCNFVNIFVLDVRPTPEFQYLFTFERDSIAVLNGFWFNFDNLLQIDCRCCQIWGTKLTNLQMNQYLKRWISGSFEKLERLSVEMEVIDLGVLLADLNAVNFPEGEKRIYKNQCNRNVTIGYGFDIRRNDNTLATILHHGGNIVSKQFHMLVWPK
ncbi:hypothetical protein CAEBREN_07626 [Caenorhabditis brenneri]|uniref:Sdz-33 F-box domain-containing protein n=1 Tax=Caenorhabditis brenneri TaxID=135651 RepID=G0MGD9_CAEBE|nr:hypothetical protein CAEBREN_07626 [Caenorhabditis brenneri]